MKGNKLSTHECKGAHTQINNPIIQAWGESFVSYHWNLTVIYGERESHYTLIHTGTQSKVTGPNIGTKKGYRTTNKATSTAVHAVVQGQHHINATQWLNSADPLNECLGCFQ